MEDDGNLNLGEYFKWIPRFTKECRVSLKGIKLLFLHITTLQQSEHNTVDHNIN